SDFAPWPLLRFANSFNQGKSLTTAVLTNGVPTAVGGNSSSGGLGGGIIVI
ncbi:hypothetical protein L195_g064545, partial [Trifolium pratense]